MYDLYPEWGPTKNRQLLTVGASTDAQSGTTLWPFDARDEHDQRPDDN